MTPTSGSGGMALHTKMLIGFVIGTVAGLAANFYGGDAGWLDGLVTYVADPVGQLFLRLLFMLVIPLVFIVAGYFIYRFRYKITPEVYGQIVNELKERGDIGEDADA